MGFHSFSLAASFVDGNTYRIDFDLSESATGKPYETFYLLYNFEPGTMNPGDGVTFGLYDHQSSLIQSYILYNYTTNDYKQYGRSVFFPQGSFVDSAGFVLFQDIIGHFKKGSSLPLTLAVF